MEIKNDIDVVGFKNGLAAIMEKHHIASVKSHTADGAFFGFDPMVDGGKRFCAYKLTFRGGHPGNLLEDIVEQRMTYMVKFGQDLKGLFKYYEIQYLVPATNENIFIGFDDGNSFVLENVSIEGMETK